MPEKAEGVEGVKIIAISAGDSHSAALSEDGRVFATGCFRVWTARRVASCRSDVATGSAGRTGILAKHQAAAGLCAHLPARSGQGTLQGRIRQGSAAGYQCTACVCMCLIALRRSRFPQGQTTSQSSQSPARFA